MQFSYHDEIDFGHPFGLYILSLVIIPFNTTFYYWNAAVLWITLLYWFIVIYDVFVLLSQNSACSVG